MLILVFIAVGLHECGGRLGEQPNVHGGLDPIDERLVVSLHTSGICHGRVPSQVQWRRQAG